MTFNNTEELKEYLENLMDKYDPIPSWFYRWRRDFTYSIRKVHQSFENWRAGYGFFPDQDAFDFYNTHAQWVLPRLRLFRHYLEDDKYPGVPMFLYHETFPDRNVYCDEISEEERKAVEDKWREIVGEMVYAFDFILNEDDFPSEGQMEAWKQNKERAEKGLQLFAKYHGCLWN